MTSKFARFLAVGCAALTLLCVLAWLVDGAPNTPDVGTFDGRGLRPYLGHQRFSPAVYLLWGMGEVHRWESYGALLIIAVSVASAALLALVLLLRGRDTPALAYLGTGLSWWSLSLSYLFVFTVVPTFESFETTGKWFRVACDVTAFQLLLASSYAFLRFWRAFPRPVTSEELDQFLEGTAGLHVKRYLGGQIARYVRGVPPAIAAPVVVLTVFVVALNWRLGVFEDDPLTPWAMLCFGVLFYAPASQCLRLFQFHRTVGTEQERRQIEWISAALWISLILFLLPGAVMPVWWLAEHWFPELEFEHGLIGIYLLYAVMAGPLVVIVALAVSILYRGNIDPQLVLRGFTVWTLLGVVLTLAFVFIERSLALRIVGWMKLPAQSGFIAAGAIVAATFQPIRKYTEKNVTRFVERVLPATLLASGTRHTLAVAVVDISGYTTLSAQDEQGALIAAAFVQREAKRLADRHGGRFVKSTGDGVILSFGDPEAGLAAVRALHQAVSAGAGALNLAGLRLHSGLHWGEAVEMHDGDLYGMVVNVAARIADWAAAGEVGVSEMLCGKFSTAHPELVAAGPQRFKNVPEAVACFRLARV